jgi:hypothetical protein
MNDTHARKTPYATAARMLIGSVLLLLLAVPAPSYAISIFGDGTLGDFTGDLTYSFTDSTHAALTLVLTNTSPAANGGFLTAFAFNNPGNKITGVSLTPSDPDFHVIGGPEFQNDIKVSPFGKFDIGAGTDSGVPGSGPPSKGIGVGITETFLFALIGTGLNTLTDLSFVTELSSAKDGGCCEFFVAGFRGFNDGGSNRTPGEVIPEPATLLLFGSGLAFGSAAYWRRRRSEALAGETGAGGR